jgi:hypothetical protein
MQVVNATHLNVVHGYTYIGGNVLTVSDWSNIRCLRGLHPRDQQQNLQQIWCLCAREIEDKYLTKDQNDKDHPTIETNITINRRLPHEPSLSKMRLIRDSYVDSMRINHWWKTKVFEEKRPHFTVQETLY